MVTACRGTHALQGEGCTLLHVHMIPGLACTLTKTVGPPTPCRSQSLKNKKQGVLYLHRMFRPIFDVSFVAPPILGLQSLYGSPLGLDAPLPLPCACGPGHISHFPSTSCFVLPTTEDIPQVTPRDFLSVEPASPSSFPSNATLSLCCINPPLPLGVSPGPSGRAGASAPFCVD